MTRRRTARLISCVMIGFLIGGLNGCGCGKNQEDEVQQKYTQDYKSQPPKQVTMPTRAGK